MPAERGARVLWNSLCEFVKEEDGLPIFSTSGLWTARKLYFVCEYLERVTTAMHSNRHFPDGLVYVDLFCGTGVSAVHTDGGRARRYPGSALIAASTPKPFSKLVLVDEKSLSTDALITRIQRRGFSGSVKVVNDDVNRCVPEIVKHIPQNSLNVAFVDPYSLDIHFETIKTIAANRPLDLIILFSDRFDLGRNVHKQYYPATEQTKLDRMLGPVDWRSRLDALDDQSGLKVRRLFAEMYLEQLRTLGYLHSEHWPIEGPNGPAFRLVFASKHPLGLKLCRVAYKEDFEGNRGLFG